MEEICKMRKMQNHESSWITKHLPVELQGKMQGTQIGTRHDGGFSRAEGRAKHKSGTSGRSRHCKPANIWGIFLWKPLWLYLQELSDRIKAIHNSINPQKDRFLVDLCDIDIPIIINFFTWIACNSLKHLAAGESKGRQCIWKSQACRYCPQDPALPWQRSAGGFSSGNRMADGWTNWVTALQRSKWRNFHEVKQGQSEDKLGRRIPGITMLKDAARDFPSPSVQWGSPSPRSCKLHFAMPRGLRSGKRKWEPLNGNNSRRLSCKIYGFWPIASFNCTVITVVLDTKGFNRKGRRGKRL